jgi:hypothetical protein
MIRNAQGNRNLKKEGSYNLRALTGKGKEGEMRYPSKKSGGIFFLPIGIHGPVVSPHSRIKISGKPVTKRDSEDGRMAIVESNPETESEDEVCISFAAALV